jgi:hypothetical protein
MPAHGVPRYTEDIDLLVNPTRANAARFVAAIHAFGFASLGLTQEDFTTAGRVVQLGLPPARIDILTEIEGVSRDQIKQGKITGDYGGVPVHIIGRREFITNKKTTGPLKDKGDLGALGEG